MPFSRLLFLILTATALILTLIVQIFVSVVTELSSTLIFVILFIGVFAQGWLAYWIEYKVQDDYIQKSKAEEQATKDQITGTLHDLAEFHIQDIMAQTIRQLEMRGKARAALYVWGNENQELRIFHQYNMLGAQDHRLSYKPFEGAVGYVWEYKNPVLVDFTKRIFTDLVKRSEFPLNISEDKLAAILAERVQVASCFPAYDSADYRNRKIIGILCLDSDNSSDLSQIENQNIAAASAISLGRWFSALHNQLSHQTQ
jgi:hypothetical protein